MKLKRELTQVAAKVKRKLTHVFDTDQLQALARQSGFVSATWTILRARSPASQLQN